MKLLTFSVMVLALVPTAAFAKGGSSKKSRKKPAVYCASYGDRTGVTRGRIAYTRCAVETNSVRYW